MISLNAAGRLVVDAKTISFTSNITRLEEPGDQPASGISDALTTTIAGQAVTAAPTAVAFAGTTLNPGAPGKMIAGTLISLNTPVSWWWVRKRSGLRARLQVWAGLSWEYSGAMDH